MKFAFRLIPVFFLATMILCDRPLPAAKTTPAKDAKALNNDPNEDFESKDLFPLAERNGIEMRVETIYPTADKNIVRHNFVPTFTGGEKALKQVVDHPETANAIHLAVASDMLFRAGNLKEAAFLYYAARVRLYHDLDKYPPKDPESASSNWFLSVVMDAVKVDLIRSLYLEPKTLAEVVKRLESFESKDPTGYTPGWDFTPHEVSADNFAKNKAIILDVLKPTSELLLMPDYFTAFRVYRTSYELSDDEQMQPAVVEGREKAMKAMKRIESEKKLHGVVYLLEQQQVD